MAARPGDPSHSPLSPRGGSRLSYYIVGPVRLQGLEIQGTKFIPSLIFVLCAHYFYSVDFAARNPIPLQIQHRSALPFLKPRKLAPKLDPVFVKPGIPGGPFVNFLFGVSISRPDSSLKTKNSAKFVFPDGFPYDPFGRMWGNRHPGEFRRMRNPPPDNRFRTGMACRQQYATRSTSKRSLPSEATHRDACYALSGVSR